MEGGQVRTRPVIRRSRSRRAFDQELAALKRWDPARVRAADPGTLTLELEFVPGVSGSLAPEVHAAAARWLRRFQDGPVQEDPLPLERAFALRIDALRREAGALASGVLDAVDPAALRGRRVWCHRDFTPQNWIWDGGRLEVIDFEHARPDHPLTDLVKLAAEVWPQHPELERAFREAWGPLDAEALDGLLRVHAVRTLAWGVRHRDPAFEALGRRLVAAFRT